VVDIRLYQSDAVCLKVLDGLKDRLIFELVRGDPHAIDITKDIPSGMLGFNLGVISIPVVFGERKGSQQRSLFAVVICFAFGSPFLFGSTGEGRDAI